MMQSFTYLPISTFNDCQESQNNIQKFITWSTNKKLNINTEKCKVLTISRNPKNYALNIKGTQLPTKFGSVPQSFCLNLNPVQDQDQDYNFTLDFNTKTTFYT